jgi:hypothetical protein
MKNDILDALCLKRKKIELPSTCEDECGQVCIDIFVITYSTLEELESMQPNKKLTSIKPC